MAITEIYVDPSIAGDSGAGTIGDPFGDLEYAIEQTTFDTTNGTRVNIKAGTDEVLAAELSTAMADTGTTVAWAPSSTAPCIFQGYTSVAGDGGIGGIDGDATVSIIASSTLDSVHFIDMHLHNTGSNGIAILDDECSFINCELDNTTGNALAPDEKSIIIGCYIHNVAGSGIVGLLANSYVGYNYFENGTNDFDYCINNCQGVFERNIMNLDGASSGIKGTVATVMHNSIFSNGGTGTGIEVNNNAYYNVVINNVVEGFSGTGGIGYDMTTGTGRVKVYGGNSAYNNATNYVASDTANVYDLGGTSSNETLTASPFTDAANGDFSPVDTGSIKEGSLPAVVGNP